MINVEMVRRLLTIADASKDPYAIAQVASELLTMDGEDRVAAAHYVKALAALKLFGAAARFVETAGESPQGGVSGIVQWTSRARRFAANLEVLESRNPDAASVVRAAAVELSRYELHLAGDGNFQVSDTTLPVHRGWLTSLADHKAAQALWQRDASKSQLLMPLVFEGFGFGWLFLRALADTEKTFLNYRCPFYVLEKDPLSLAMAMHVHDLTEVFASSRVRLFVARTGDETLQAFRAALLKKRHWTLPDVVIHNSLRVTASLDIEKTLQEIQAARQQQTKELSDAIRAYYAEKNDAFWKERFANAGDTGSAQPPLRVLGITSRFTTVLRYSMAELQEAVRAVGQAEMQIAMEPDDESLENPVLEMIASFKPDLIAQISRMRYEHSNLPENVPFLCWDQDNLPCMRPPNGIDALKGQTFVAGHGALFGSLYLGWPLRKCIFSHATGMTHRYGHNGSIPEVDARYRADMSYVSHASASPEQLRDSLGTRWCENENALTLYRALSDTVLEALRAGRRWDFWSLRDLIAKTAVARSVAVLDAGRDELVNNLTLISDRAFRHETLAWAARWCESRGRTLRLWGNGWDQHPTLSRYAGGPVLPGVESGAVYRATTINLQIIETGILHSRVLDGWATGAFFVIRQSVRPEDEAKTLDLYEIGRLTQIAGIETIGALEKQANPELLALWRTVEADYREFPRDTPFAGFSIWQQLPPAQVLIPNLRDILFRDEASFSTMADRYINAPTECAAAVGGIRAILESRLSYDARWREFRRHIARNL